MAEALLEELRSLPHWARVAFAARCALTVEPLFRQAWPNATAETQESVRAAIRLAEQSAAKAQPLEGLEKATTNAICAAGGALLSVYGFPSDEPAPTNQQACVT